jgi:site-specific recombinase XerD
MKLAEVAGEYVALKQAMGMRFCTEARTLKAFCRAMGDVTMGDIQAERVVAFLAGSGPVTRFWQRKQEVLVGFYRFALARGYALQVPLPRRVPKVAQAFVPYIYSPEEVRRLLEAVASSDTARGSVEPSTWRTLILLLYGAGLRISEALALTRADVDLCSGGFSIHASKFYKTRLVPLGPQLTRALSAYATRRGKPPPSGPQGPFFATRSGKALTRRAAEYAFDRLRRRAGVQRSDGSRYQPRLHDLRHAFAVGRLVSWYRQGADVQRLLPQLATYLGHVHLAATQRYLTLTPELLQQASQRFEAYAGELAHG